MKKSLILTQFLLLLIISVMFNDCLCYDESLSEFVREIYSKLVDAEEKGADVREAALKLNRALQLIREARNDPENKSALLSEARALIEDVNANIPLLIREGENALLWRNVTMSSAVALIVVISVLAYRFGPRIFWEAWLKLRPKWIVEVVKSHKNRSDKN